MEFASRPTSHEHHQCAQAGTSTTLIYVANSKHVQHLWGSLIFRKRGPGDDRNRPSSLSIVSSRSPDSRQVSRADGGWDNKPERYSFSSDSETFSHAEEDRSRRLASANSRSNSKNKGGHLDFFKDDYAGDESDEVFPNYE